MLTSKILNARPIFLIGDLSSQPPDPSATISTHPGFPIRDLRSQVTDRISQRSEHSSQITCCSPHLPEHTSQGTAQISRANDPHSHTPAPGHRFPAPACQITATSSQFLGPTSQIRGPYFRITAPRSRILVPEALFPDTGSLARAPGSPIPVRKSQDAIYPPDRSAQSTDPKFKLPESRYQKTDAGHQLAGT